MMTKLRLSFTMLLLLMASMGFAGSDTEETNVYILGEVNENDWAPNDGVRMEYNNDEGVYTATITADGRNEGYNYFGFTTELAENNDEGGWDYIEPFRLGATGEDDFLVTDEFLGQELSLTWDDYHAFKIPEGEYTLTLDLDNLRLLIERKQSAPEDVYILGLVNGNWGDADVGVKMDYNASSGLYTATVTIGEKYSETEEYDGYIIFSNKLAENWNGWDEIESYLFGATGEDDFVMTNSLMGKNISLTYDNPQWLQIPYGKYTLNLNLDNLTLVIRKKAVNDTVFILGNIDNNDFCVAEEVSVLRYDNVTRKRPDVVLYINGIALGIFELKSSYVSSGNGIRQLLQNQKQENIQNFFSINVFIKSCLTKYTGSSS